MKHLATVFLFSVSFIIGAGVAPMVDIPEEQGAGSCYEVKPICLGGGKPVCMCTYSMNCYWVCK